MSELAVAAFPGVEAFDRTPRPVWAKPYVWREPAQIPRREWLYGGHFIRKFVSTTVAPGGVGKSSLVLVEALAIASGKALLGVIPNARARVWYFNGEDPAEETDRRVAAACLHYGLSAADLVGWLFLGCGRDAGLVIAEQTRDGAVINAPHVEGIEAMMRELRIDLAILDPFVSTHRVPENDNGAIDTVAKAWAGIADRVNAGVELVHHVRKGASAGHEFSVEDGRGAVALLAAARSARVLNVMSEDEATRAGVDGRRAYFRTDNGKSNLGPPPEGASWFRIQSVALGNGSALVEGDSVGVASSWPWPDHMDGVSAADLLKVQQAVAAGRWRENAQAKDWVGLAVGDAMSLNHGDKRQRAKIKALLKMWLTSGALTTISGKDEKRNERTYVEVGEWVSLGVEEFK